MRMPATFPPVAGSSEFPPPASAASRLNGICSTPAVTTTIRPASRVMPSTRQKLPRTSRQDRASARTGPSRSSTTTCAAIRNMTANQIVRMIPAIAPSAASPPISAPGACSRARMTSTIA